MIDTHLHLHFSQFDGDRGEVISRALEQKVDALIEVGTSVDSSRRALTLAEGHDGIFVAVGIHPHEAKNLSQGGCEELRHLASEAKVVALGEMGLDYYRDLAPRELQKRAFEAQLALAKELNKPVIIHNREAHQDIMATLEGAGRGVRGVLHCFSGNLPMAMRCLDMGLYISVAGPVTYPNAARILDVVRAVPLDRLLLETDSPFLAPHPLRGRRNEPANLPLIAKRVAEVRGLELQALAKATSENARRLFGLSEKVE